ncbi:hypothetical protein [Methylobacterium sp. E-005]|nr:hypothetical protein [Methylobacterium sp. E-005]
MSAKLCIFSTEAEAQDYAIGFGGKAKVVYRGDYRKDWLVTVDD